MAIPGPWNTSGTANSLADAIRRQAAAQSKQAEQKSGLVDTGAVETDPLSQLLQQIQNINVSATPYDQLLGQATASVSAQYDPLIQELQSQMGRMTKKGEANAKTAKQMYGDLATDIAAELPEVTQRMAAASQEAQGQYDATQQALQQEYQKNAQAQNDLYKQLGIQAAAPEASQQAMEDQAYFQQQSKADEANALQALKEMGASDTAYTQQTADNTRLAGVNASADIMQQLQDYLATAGDKLAGYRAGKESSIQAALAQLQQSDAERMQQQEQTEYDRLMDMFNLQLKMQEMNTEANNQSSLFKGTNSLSGASNVLGELYGDNDSFTSGAIMDEITQLMSNPDVIAGKYKTGEKDQYGKDVYNKTTNEYLIDLLRKQMTTDEAGTPFSGTQYSATDINNAILALMAYQGKLR